MRMRMRKLSNNAAFLPAAALAAALVASRRRKAMDDGLDVDLTVEELSDHLLGTDFPYEMVKRLSAFKCYNCRCSK